MENLEHAPPCINTNYFRQLGTARCDKVPHGVPRKDTRAHSAMFLSATCVIMGNLRDRVTCYKDNCDGLYKATTKALCRAAGGSAGCVLAEEVSTEH